MRTIYFDCFAGASGDMILGALVGAGADPRQLLDQLSLLGIGNYEVDFSTVNRSGISAARARVRTVEERAHRHLSDILKLIEDSRLGDGVKARASRIFSRLAEAESRVHNVPVEQIHFHEVGALDAIIDVVGACICFELLGIERFGSSALHVGSGMVKMAHGLFPVPPPAVAELLQGLPVYASDIKGELVTPTGAAIVATLCESFGPVPPMRLLSTGYGAGAREYEKFPNVLRVLVGESEAEGGEDEGGRDEELTVVETNVDDVSPQVLGHVLELALARGALDCYLTPVQMKKNRPGVLVSILCRADDREAMLDLLLAETPTLGARSYGVRRRALEREAVTVETEFGRIAVKVGRLRGRVLSATPEFEDCREAALKFGVTLREAQEAARAAFRESKGQGGGEG